MVYWLKKKSEDWKELNELFFFEKIGKKYLYKCFYEIWKSVLFLFLEYFLYIVCYVWVCYMLIDKMGEDFKNFV